MSGLSKFAAVSLDQPIKQDRWLKAGIDYAVVIEDLDAERAEETGRIGLVFRATEGTHRDSIFVRTRDGSAYSWQMRALLGATLPDLTAQQTFSELLRLEDTAVRVLESMRGMRVLLRLEQTEGFRVLPNAAAGTYRAVNTMGATVAEAATFTEAERRARAMGLQKSYRRIKFLGVLDEDTRAINLQAFDSAVASIKRAQGAAGNHAGPDAVPYTVPDAKW